MRTMKTILYMSMVLGLCLVGMTAALLRLRRLDYWCERQLTDV